MQSYFDRFTGVLQNAKDTVLNNVEITSTGKYCSANSVWYSSF